MILVIRVDHGLEVVSIHLGYDYFVTLSTVYVFIKAITCGKSERSQVLTQTH